MKNLAIVGSQWGDEGKGKITDYFSGNADYVVRWAGGDNAGHSISIKGKRYALNAIPSGIFHAGCTNVIATGCVVNLRKLIQEIKYLTDNGFNCDNLKISDRCHLIFPYHQLMDEKQEEFRGADTIGTTKKGIGPAYQDKAERIGIRMCDLFDKDLFYKKLTNNLKFKNEVFTKIFNCAPVSVDEVFTEYLALFEQIKHMVCNTSILINNAIKANKRVLFEGAQGVLLDLNYGTYPYVTSSHPTAAAIPVEVGMSPRLVGNILGVVKAYNTRVGNGPFPAEINGELASYIREKGREYGVVSGRPRRIGWFDAVIMKHSIMVTGYTHLAITLFDVLSDIETLKICVGYELDGEKIDYVPASIQDFERCKPIFIEMPGFKEDITKVTSFDQLPVNAQNYLRKIEEIVEVKVGLFSVGPDREQTILLDDQIF